jgi:hypothetical protein
MRSLESDQGCFAHIPHASYINFVGEFLAAEIRGRSFSRRNPCDGRRHVRDDSATESDLPGSPQSGNRHRTDQCNRRSLRLRNRHGTDDRRGIEDRADQQTEVAPTSEPRSHRPANRSRTDERTEDRTDEQTEGRTDQRTEDRTDQRNGDRTDEQTEDRTDMRQSWHRRPVSVIAPASVRRSARQTLKSIHAFVRICLQGVRSRIRGAGAWRRHAGVPIVPRQRAAATFIALCRPHEWKQPLCRGASWRVWVLRRSARTGVVLYELKLLSGHGFLNLILNHR